MRHITVDLIQEDPSIIESMTTEEIHSFKRLYYRKRIPSDIRASIHRRRIAINKQHRLYEKCTVLNNRLSAVWDRVEGLWKKPNTFKLIQYHARSMGTDIHDFPSVWSGYESVESVKHRRKNQQQDRPYTGCKEHYHPRQWAGMQIINSLLGRGKHYTMYDLAYDICSYSHVHIVTQRENQILLPYQTTTNFINPRLAYQKAGIELIQVSPIQVNTAWTTVLDQLHFRCVVEGHRR